MSDNPYIFSGTPFGNLSDGNVGWWTRTFDPQYYQAAVNSAEAAIARDFNSREAAIARDFSAKEAEKK